MTRKNIPYYLAGSAALLTFLVYLPALRNNFVELDDAAYVLDNPYIRSFNHDLFRWAFFQFYAANWHPLTWISHAFDYALWGLNPMGHHLTSIVLHAINTFVVVLLVARLVELGSPPSSLRVTPPPPAPPLSALRRIRRGEKIRGGRGSYEFIGDGGGFSDRWVLIAAGITGLLFGLHPVHVESVAWVAERKDLLCALFFLLSIMQYVRYATGHGKTSLPVIPAEAGIQGIQGTLDTPVKPEYDGNKKVNPAEGGIQGFQGTPDIRVKPERDENKIVIPRLDRGIQFLSRYYLFALIFFILALLSKPMAVTLPVVLLILDWYPFGRIVSMKTGWEASVEKIPFIVLSGISSVLTVLAQKAGESLVSTQLLPLSGRILLAARSLLAYLGNMVLPRDLVPYYPYPGLQEISFHRAEYLIPVILVTVITAASIKTIKRQKIWFAVWCYYLATLLPVLGIVQVGGQAMADRYTYLPSLGPFLLVGLAGAWIYKRANSEAVNARLINRMSFAVAVAAVLLLSVLTVRQIGIWKNSMVVFDAILAKDSRRSPMVYFHRGVAYEKMGNTEGAIDDYTRAISLFPTYYEAFFSRATAYERLGRLDLALDDYTRAISLKPSSYEAYTNRGLVNGKLGRKSDAIADFDRAVSLSASAGKAYLNLGIVHAEDGRFTEAIEEFSRAIAADPMDADAYGNRGITHALLGQQSAALKDFDKAVELRPDFAVIYFNRGKLYAASGQQERASADFQQACRLGDEISCRALQK